jgi:hypothetical protein
MSNFRKVQIQYTGGFPAGDYELQREGFEIGQTYTGEMLKSGKVVWVDKHDKYPCAFHVDLNCIILNLDPK